MAPLASPVAIGLPSGLNATDKTLPKVSVKQDFAKSA